MVILLIIMGGGIYPNETEEDRGLVFDGSTELICLNEKSKQFITDFSLIFILKYFEALPNTGGFSSSWFSLVENTNSSLKIGIGSYYYGSITSIYIYNNSTKILEYDISTNDFLNKINIVEMSFDTKNNNIKLFLNGELKQDLTNKFTSTNYNFYYFKNSEDLLSVYLSGAYLYNFKFYTGIHRIATHNKYSNYLYSVLYNE